MVNAEQIRAARGMADWTREDLATAIGMSAEAVKKIERGLTRPHESTVDKIVQAFAARQIEFTASGVQRIDRTVTILESENAYLDVLDDVVRTLGNTGGEVLIAFNRGNLTNQDVVDRWLRMRRAGVRLRLLCEENDTFFRTPLEEVRLVPSRYFINQLSFIYANKVTFNVRDGSTTNKIILIENELIAAQQRNMFDFFWHNGKMPKESTCPEDQRYEALLMG